MAEKVAVLFGNNAYADGAWQHLEAAKNDVGALFAEFTKHHFACLPHFDVTARDFDKAIKDAAEVISEVTKLIVLHVSAHAIERDNKNKIISVEGEEIDLVEAINGLLKNASQRAGILVVLDCCRKIAKTLPSESASADGGSSRGGGSPVGSSRGRPGPGELMDRRNIILLYACSPNRVARERSDGQDLKNHGILSKAALNHLFKRASLRQCLDDIKKEVAEKTTRCQEPWTEDNCGDALMSIGNPILYERSHFELAQSAAHLLREKRRQEEELRNDMERLKHGKAAQEADLQNELNRVSKALEACKQGSSTPRRRTPSYGDDAASNFGSASLPSTPSRGSRSFALCELPERRPWVVVEGNIGVGKSRLLELFRVMTPSAYIVQEPIEEWKDALCKLQEDPARNAFQSQMTFWTHFAKIPTGAARQTIISERGPLSVVDVFCKKFRKQGHLTAEQHKIFTDLLLIEERENRLPTHYVLLEADIDTCRDRKNIRDRSFERNVDNSYLKDLQQIMNKVYSGVEKTSESPGRRAKVVRINASKEESAVHQEFREKMQELFIPDLS